MGLKISTSDRAHWSCSAKYLIIWQLTSIPPKQAICEKEQHIKRVSEHPTQSHNLLVTLVTQSSPSSRKEIIYMQGTIGKHRLCYYLIFIFSKLNEWGHWDLRDVITCPSGRARIQVQVCMTPNLFTKPHYYRAFSANSFSYGWGPWHNICFAINM